ncbi:MAG: hypothetical protein J6Z27_00145, partial [Bacteroidales bacterium]|nr:hypothetical protein [Bacteroidales bacterium]
RMLREYPDLNAEWLLLGVGKPYKNGIEKQEIVPLPTQEPDFEDMPDFEDEPEQPSYPSLFSPEEPAAEAPVETESNNIDKQEEIIVNQSTDKSKIDKIIILYDNGTYEVR